jgi:hypothetical protein
MLSFKSQELEVVSRALDVAEDITANHYKFSAYQWKNLNYDLKTLLSLNSGEVEDGVFALLNRGVRILDDFDHNSKKRDFYFICLQDHHILRALKRDNRLGLFPLLIYILTHELIHVVRFCSYQQRFWTSTEEREKEEQVVHETTFKVLKDLSLPHMDYILDSYRNHRICNVAI